MDAAQALADLTEISSQIQAAVLLDAEGAVVASTLDEERSGRLAEAARALLAAAGEGREGLTQVEAATLEGSVFLVRDGDRVIVATTTPEPTVGLVFYDLKSALRSAAGQKPASPRPRKRAPRAKPKPAQEQEPDAAS